MSHFVISDKLLLNTLTGKPQLQDSNPNTLWAASPQDQLPGCPQISVLKPERDLTLGNLLRLDELKIPASKFLMPRVPVNLTNEREGQAKDPGITWASTEGETKKLPVECGPPRDDQPHNLTRKFGSISFAVHLPQLCTFCLPNPAYLEFTLEEILIYNPEARTRETETIYREGTKITRPPLLFCGKYNYLPKYLVPMTLPLTLRPKCLQEFVAANESATIQIFGVMYITLTGLIDSMIPASRPWALLGKLLSYIVKLAPILW
ncbi:hypothetical protein DSO57_1022721 [Entomophthora muscae]|uniref:Uncharacterized protein n=1 Tax=Entomophthora muscae TaxID=34485 RepID=A0ACC2RHV5_9FUNG|nr:hypothetical protein DSO57_1022721 [Entomophthora muscae]